VYNFIEEKENKKKMDEKTKRKNKDYFVDK